MSFHSDIWWWFWNPSGYVWNDKYFHLIDPNFPASFKFFLLLTFSDNVFIVFLSLVGQAFSSVMFDQSKLVIPYNTAEECL